MLRRNVSGLILTLLLIVISILASEFQPVGASGTIYIRADGSIDPPTANITSSDNVTYYFTDNINESIVVERDDIVVDGAGYTLQGRNAKHSRGIYLYRDNNVTIKNVKITLFWYGIWLNSSSCNLISGNVITAAKYAGVLLYNSSNNNISGNSMTNNDGGIRFYHSSHARISGNEMVENGGYGVWLSDSSNISIFGNNMANNEYGTRLEGSSNISIFGNNMANNEYGVWFSGSSDIVVSGNNVTANGDGIRLYNSSNIAISGNNVMDNYYKGIRLEFFSNDNNIYGNSITNNSQCGIGLHSSFNNTVYENNVTANGDGIRLSDSMNNTVSGNDVMDNHYKGIWLSVWTTYLGSSNNLLRNNNMNNNGHNFGVWGYTSSHFVNDVDTSNTVDGKPIYYWINKRNMSLPLDAGYVALINCTNITVENLNITKNAQGVVLISTTDSTISGNRIKDNDWGICLVSSSYNIVSENNITDNYRGIYLKGRKSELGNTISGNRIANNEYGIYLDSSSNNFIYHNNFVDNTEQVYSHNSINSWDDGVGEGNYWSNYKDRLPYVEEKDGSGIWNAPYIINENNRDNYPLINTWAPDLEIPFWMQWWFWGVIAIIIIAVLTGTVYLLRKRKPPTPTVPELPSEGATLNLHYSNILKSAFS